MCNRITRVLRGSLVESEEIQVEMEGVVSNSNSNEDNRNPRLKFLCSFNGSILPRPVDGKLRYVGGETRIVSVPRDIGFEELMVKMKELFDGVSVLKYQQPDEDLDALVSVVNDDDVVNMMEEYDKLGSGDGFTRLRIFLFSNQEHDDSVHFVEGDERDNERRYVDALNSLNDSPEFGKQQMSEFQMAPVEDGFSNQRTFDIPSPVNLHPLAVPPLNSLHHQPLDSPWSPAYYDFPASPSYAPYPEDYFGQQHVNPQPPENVLLLPPAPISGEKAGFPGIVQGSAIFEGNNVCEHCRPPFSRNQTPELPNVGNGFYHAPNLGPPAYLDDRHVAPHYVHHEDQDRPRYTRHGPEFGNEYGNFPYAYGPENIYHASSHGNAYWRNVQSQVHGSNPYEALGLPQQENEICNLRFIRTRMEQTPRMKQTPRMEQTPGPRGAFDVAGVPDNSQGNSSTMMQNSYNLENQHHPDPATMSLDNKELSLKILNEPRNGTGITESKMKVEEKDGCEREESIIEVNMKGKNTSSLQLNVGITSNFLPAEKIIRAESPYEDNALVSPKKDQLEIKCLSSVPQYIESVKKAALQGDEEVKGEAQENAASAPVNDAKAKEETVRELDAMDGNGDVEVDADGETQNNLKIEQTKAEEEAIAKGLQTIKNDDLEEIRELGSGTYGAVYHGKWKGSDVAIKRIKASCFAGKPSERERLIAEFWREALILSSLHHPNVVSFYGIVRDGPDGSLATVTEFMINGSLKQFLRKKDRTIDRRKRLIIAMDAAFGMEYLHGKNIVHFDLKCENLLVNMRDPHRPICKIGDLGLSKVKQHTLVSGGVRGTLPWMAPELLSGKSHMVTEKIDVYSFGIVMWELLTGDEPYGDMHCASIIGGIVNNSLRPTVPTWCDPEWKSLMGNCWSAESTQRPSFSEISQKLRTMAAAVNVK